MDTISPVLVDAFHLLRSDLYEHLEEAEALANKDEAWDREDVETARKLILDLVLVIRGLVYEHRVTPGGDCRICSSAWPCLVVTMIHELIKDPDREFVALVNRVRDAE
jgi:hypothetical protein